MLGFSDIKSLSCDELEEFLKSEGFKPEIYQILKGIVHFKELVKPGVLQLHANACLVSWNCFCLQYQYLCVSSPKGINVMIYWDIYLVYVIGKQVLGLFPFLKLMYDKLLLLFNFCPHIACDIIVQLFLMWDTSSEIAGLTLTDVSQLNSWII